jgi:hypothetical protein
MIHRQEPRQGDRKAVAKAARVDHEELQTIRLLTDRQSPIEVYRALWQAQFPESAVEDH